MSRLLDRLAARYGYYPREFARVRIGDDAVVRGRRWEDFYREEGGLRDMLDGLRRGYFEKVGTLKPGDTQALQLLGIADRIVREIEGEVRNVIETGVLAAHKAEHAEKIVAIGR